MRVIPLSEYYDSPPSSRGGSGQSDAHAVRSFCASDWRLRRAERAAVPAVRSTRAVTRVESLSPDVARRVAKIDWLNCTFPASDEVVASDFAEWLFDWMGLRVCEWTDDGTGIFGYERCHWFSVVLPSGAKSRVGFFAWGGEAQRGSCMLQLTGQGCGLVRNWDLVLRWLQQSSARITRVDLAVDFLNGEHSVDESLDLYFAGAFTSRGRLPKLQIQGDWQEGGTGGRTVYIGKLKNGKTLCVYEKGKQLGDRASDWTRFEVRLGNRDRVIPLDVLTDPGKYFTGAYPALQGMLSDAAERVPTVQRETQSSLASLAVHMERCYGKAIHEILATTGATPSELIEEVRVIGIPRRVDPAGGVLGVAWADFQAQKRRLEA